MISLIEQANLEMRQLGPGEGYKGFAALVLLPKFIETTQQLDIHEADTLQYPTCNPALDTDSASNASHPVRHRIVHPAPPSVPLTPKEKGRISVFPLFAGDQLTEAVFNVPIGVIKILVMDDSESASDLPPWEHAVFYVPVRRIHQQAR